METIDEEEVGPRLILSFMRYLTYQITNLFRSELNCDLGYIPRTKIESFICKIKERLRRIAEGVNKWEIVAMRLKLSRLPFF